ncbi:hypothetical protein GPALN_013236 [Globodera pallida]|nr:hypothetical protein GPALN_013236 [Globodera pallida]
MRLSCNWGRRLSPGDDPLYTSVYFGARSRTKKGSAGQRVGGRARARCCLRSLSGLCHRGSGSSPGGWKEESESLEADSDSKFKSGLWC